MTRQLQRERERIFVDHLKELYSDFPSGEISDNKSDPPDVLVKGQNSKLGIEVTELFPRITKEENTYLQRGALENKIIEKAKSELLRLMNEGFQINITFQKDLSIRKQDTDRLAESICRIIKKETEGKIYGGYKPFYFPKSKLPREIEELDLIYSPKMTHSCWNYGHGAILRGLETPELIQVIEKKNNDISKKDLNFPIWLLIVEPHDKLLFSQVPSSLKGIDKKSFAKIIFLRATFDSFMEI